MENATLPANTSIDLDEINRNKVIKHLPILVIILLMLIIGIVGNVLVLVVYKYKLKRSSARVYIISLALADLFVCVVGIPYHTLDKIWIVNYSQATVCRTLSFLMVAGSFSSVFVLLVVGLDRFLKVCRPLKKQIKDFGDRKACFIAIVTGIVIAVPVIALYGNSSYDSDLGYTEINCFVDDCYRGSSFAVVYLSLYLLIFVISVVFLVIIYGFICRKIYEHDKLQGEVVLDKTRGFCSCTSAGSDDADEELNEDQDSDQTDDKNIKMKIIKSGDDCKASADCDSADSKPLVEENAKKASKTNKKKGVAKIPSSAMIRHTAGTKQEKNTRKITLMMFTITVVFIIAYLPYIIISILDTLTDYWDGMSEFEALLNDFLLRVYVTNNVANPIIYCFWDKRFRKECVRLIKCCIFCKGTGGDSSKNTPSSSGSSRETHHTVAQ